jgi:hypothetical protein
MTEFLKKILQLRLHYESRCIDVDSCLFALSGVEIYHLRASSVDVECC